MDGGRGSVRVFALSEGIGSHPRREDGTGRQLERHHEPFQSRQERRGEWLVGNAVRWGPLVAHGVLQLEVLRHGGSGPAPPQRAGVCGKSRILPRAGGRAGGGLGGGLGGGD